LHEFGGTDTELKVYVEIIDNDEWEPDLDFLVELYDKETGKRLEGDDTRTRVTILDEDSPGIIGFEITQLSVSKDQDYIEVLIKREKGSDGVIKCICRTEALNDEDNA